MFCSPFPVSVVHSAMFRDVLILIPAWKAGIRRTESNVKAYPLYHKPFCLSDFKWDIGQTKSI